jgi:hypothetical protein
LTADDERAEESQPLSFLIPSPESKPVTDLRTTRNGMSLSTPFFGPEEALPNLKASPGPVDKHFKTTTK